MRKNEAGSSGGIIRYTRYYRLPALFSRFCDHWPHSRAERAEIKRVLCRLPYVRDRKGAAGEKKKKNEEKAKQ